MKTLSIIIPVLNEQCCITYRLAALQYLRNTASEIILVDGGSTDSTVEFARPLVDQIVLSEGGRANQMNAGAEYAKSDILLFLHIDTTLPANAIELVLRAVGNDEFGWGWFKLQFNNPSFVFRVIAACMNLRAAATNICTGDQTLFLTGKLFLEIGGFPEIPLMEDIAISKILRRVVNPKIIVAFVRTSARRWKKNGILRTVFLMWYLRLLFFLGVKAAKLAEYYYPKRLMPVKKTLFKKADLSSFQFPGCRIILFAKAPVLGKVKTRLEPELGQKGSLELHKAMTRRIITLLDSIKLAPWDLWLSSGERNEVFLGQCKDAEIFLQKGNDLGQKMANASLHSFARVGVESVLIIGSDCPAFDAEYLVSAIKALEKGYDVVLGPAEDFGYILIGLNAPYVELFEGVAWGSEKVLKQTLAKVRELNLNLLLLDALWDVDRPQDLARLADLKPPFRW